MRAALKCGETFLTHTRPRPVYEETKQTRNSKKLDNLLLWRNNGDINKTVRKSGYN